MHTYFHSSTIYNGKDLETYQIINICMGKEIKKYIYNETFNYRKRRKLAFCSQPRTNGVMISKQNQGKENGGQFHSFMLYKETMLKENIVLSSY